MDPLSFLYARVNEHSRSRLTVLSPWLVMIVGKQLWAKGLAADEDGDASAAQGEDGEDEEEDGDYEEGEDDEDEEEEDEEA